MSAGDSPMDVRRDTPSPGPTKEEVGDEFWDPPCKICKKVDDEENVLCELCNDAYHLACIKDKKPPLPRSPEDDEWFCWACIRRGVPEEIIDRVGRSHFLVKWLGRASTEVSWEDAAQLDTAWGRKVIHEYVTRTEPAKRAAAQILPPSHPLVDTVRAAAAAGSAGASSSSDSTHAPAEAVAEPAADAQAAGGRLLDVLRALTDRSFEGHALAPIARETARMLRVSLHPRCAGLAPWVASPDPAGPQARTAVDRAANALSEAAALIDPDGFGKPAAASGGAGTRGPRRASAGKHFHHGKFDVEVVGDDGAPPRAAPPPPLGTPLAEDAPLENASTPALLGTLHALATRTPHPPAHTLAPVALGAARVLLWHGHPEWASPMPSWHAAIERAAHALQSLRNAFDAALGPPPVEASNAAAAAAAAANAPANILKSYLLYVDEHRDGLRREEPDLSDAEVLRRLRADFTSLDEAGRSAVDERALLRYQHHAVPPSLAGTAKRTAGAGGGGAHCGGRGDTRRRKPCMVCSETDRRDALVCGTCGARQHLMCVWPPMAAAPEGEWTCEACRCAPPSKVPKPGDELEAEVQEKDKEGTLVWKRAVVIKSLPRERFVLMINPDEEDGAPSPPHRPW